MTERKWILLVEDNAKDADLAMRALAAQQTPDEILRVADGAEALDCLYQRGVYRFRVAGLPGLVLVDLKMPKVDGLEVLRQIKKDAALKNIPVVVFTSSRERADLARAYQLGANAYVVKPVGFQEFVSVLRDIKRFWLSINETPQVELTKGAGRPAQPHAEPAHAD
jgi:CheY-like chemotaxis protein